MTTNDTATFEVKPPSTKSMEVKIGSINDSFPEFGGLMIAQKRGNQEMVEIDLFRCKGSGMPHTFAEKAWSEGEITIKAFWDSDEDAVYRIRHISPS